MLKTVVQTRFGALVALCSTLLVACPHTDVTEVPFDSDASILRGSWNGTVTEVCNKPFELLDWNSSSQEVLGARPYLNTALRKYGARVSIWDALSGDKKLEWEIPWPAEKNTEYVRTFKYATFQNTVAAYDIRRVLLFDRSSGATLGSMNAPLNPLRELGQDTPTLSANLERYLRVIADTGYAYNNSGAIRAQVFEVKTGQLVMDLPLNEPLLGLAVNPEGSWVAISLPKKGVTVYEVSSGKQLYNLPSYQSGNPRFSADSKLISIPKDEGFEGWKLEQGQATRVESQEPNPTSPLSITDGGCSVQLVGTQGNPGRKLNLEPLENFPLSLDLNANYIDRNSYKVTGTARFKDKTFDVSGKVNGNTSTEFLKPQHAPPQPILAELNLLENGQGRYTFNLYGGPSYARYGSAYGGLSAVAWDDRLFSLELTKP